MSEYSKVTLLRTVVKLQENSFTLLPAFQGRTNQFPTRICHKFLANALKYLAFYYATRELNDNYKTVSSVSFWATLCSAVWCRAAVCGMVWWHFVVWCKAVCTRQLFSCTDHKKIPSFTALHLSTPVNKSFAKIISKIPYSTSLSDQAWSDMVWWDKHKLTVGPCYQLWQLQWSYSKGVSYFKRLASALSCLLFSVKMIVKAYSISSGGTLKQQMWNKTMHAV